MRQPDLFAAPQSRPEPAVPNLAHIRKSLGAYLRLIRNADILPWSEYETGRLSQHFPALAQALPPEEAEALTASFFQELQRLGWPDAITQRLQTA